ncbi:rna-directed dna polymerase from mobile element hypothetical protein [Limosa lapponica baueri]|uniref:Rna-directed dna polymerase from mobile element jockey-like n=1 Tax=Limosa lapponica baueri TaxID=1758121 RepID=A0A2I0UGR6_LIMLA|nr:rna-directed dna polymerase from mobile element hypothetical protein [Limosa lapponica baueri]
MHRDVKDKKKGFKFIGSKRKTRENLGLLLNEVDVMMMEDAEKAELLNAFFASVFTAMASPQEYQTLEVPIGSTTRVLRELADVIAKPLSIIFERSWRTEEVPEDWRKANVIPVLKKSRKEDPGNYRPVSLISIPGKVIEQLILDVISKHLEEKKVIGSSQHGLTKGKHA